MSKIIQQKGMLIISKETILASSDYNLSGDRYRTTTDYTNAKWPMVELGEIMIINFGERITKSKNLGTEYPVYGGGGESFRTDRFNRENEYVIARFAMGENCFRYVQGKFWMMDSGGTFSILDDKKDLVSKEYVGKVLLNIQDKIYDCARGNAQKNLNNEHFYKIQIPLPPLSVQEEIVKEIDVYQKIIDGAKMVIANWKPKIDIDPEWERVRLGEVVGMQNGKAHEQFVNEKGRFRIVSSGFVSSEGKEYKNTSEQLFPLYKKDVCMVMSDVPNGKTIAKCFLVDCDNLYSLNQRVGLFKSKNLDTLSQEFLYYQLNRNKELLSFDNGQSQTNLRKESILEISLYLPSLLTQNEIAERIEHERKLVEGAKELVVIYEQKIKSVIQKVWG